MSNDEIYEDCDFVFAGKRILGGGKAGVEIIMLLNGALGKSYFFEHTKKRNYAIGGIYRGASFCDDGAKGIDAADYQSSWDVFENISVWQAKSDEADCLLRNRKFESDAKKNHSIEDLLLPLRKTYEASRKQRDVAAMESLEKAVLRALKVTPKSDE